MFPDELIDRELQATDGRYGTTTISTQERRTADHLAENAMPSSLHLPGLPAEVPGYLTLVQHDIGWPDKDGVCCPRSIARIAAIYRVSRQAVHDGIKVSRLVQADLEAI